MSESIFDIARETEQIKALFADGETVNKETGEITVANNEKLQEMLDELKVKGIEKVAKLRYVILDKMAKIEMAKRERKKTDDFIKRNEKAIEKVKYLLKYYMDFEKKDKIELKNGASVAIAKIDSYFYDEEVLKAKACHLFDLEMKLDKIEAKKLFKQGLIKEGIRVSEKEIIRIK